MKKTCLNIRTLSNDTILTQTHKIWKNQQARVLMQIILVQYHWLIKQPHSKELQDQHQCPVVSVSGLFRGSQLNWAALTKEAYAIYMSIKKSTFYLTGDEITLRSDHPPLKKFLRKMTLNNMVNNWSTEIESFNINFIHISGKANILAETLNRLIDTDPDLKQQPVLEGHEFVKYCFETLPKVRGSVCHKRVGGSEVEVCEIQITYDNPKNSELSVELPLEDDKSSLCNSRT